MSQKGKTNKFDAVGSVMDFIFQEADKPVNKRRPVKPSGVSAGGALSEALVSALEKPGVYISNTALDELNSILEVKLASADFGTQGKITVSSGNIVDIIRDPAGFVQKQIDKAKTQRKASRIRFLGEAMDDFLATSIAHKYGDLEAKEIALANSEANQRIDSYKVSRAIGQSVRDASSGLNSEFMMSRNVDLLGRKAFGADWSTMSEVKKKEFRDVLSGSREFQKLRTSSNASLSSWEPSVTGEQIRDYLERTYGSARAQAFENEIGIDALGKAIDISDPNAYKALEREYLERRIQGLGNPLANSPDGQKLKIYKKSLNFINLKTRDQIKDLKNQLNSQNLDQSKRQEIEKAIKDGETALRNIGGGHGLFNEVGRWEGYIDSLNNVWGGVVGAPKLASSILDGSFFDKNRNKLFNPVQETKVGGVKIYRAKYQNGRHLSNSYNRMGETLYYLTPRSMLRTLIYNGEGFAVLLGRSLDAMRTSKWFDSTGLNADELIKSFNDLSGKDFNRYFSETLSRVKGLMNPNDYAKFERLFKSASTLKKFTHGLSFVSRIKDKFDLLMSTRMKRFRASILRMLLKNEKIRNWLVENGALKLFGQWVSKGGIQVLSKAIITSVLGIAGQVLTPVGAMIVSALTWLMTDFIFKMMKWGFDAIKLLLMGIIGFFFLVSVIGFGAQKKANNRNYSYSYIAPGEVVSCGEYGLSLGPIGTNPNPPPYNTPCAGGNQSIDELFSLAKVYVSDNYGNVSSANLLLVADCSPNGICPSLWCVAGWTITCKNIILGQSCETLYNLFVHELMHLVQPWDCGNGSMREWGADYLSNNGGLYRFIVGGQCIRATETPMPPECSSLEVVRKVAQCVAGSGNPCREALARIIGGTCRI